MRNSWINRTLGSSLIAGALVLGNAGYAHAEDATPPVTDSANYAATTGFSQERSPVSPGYVPHDDTPLAKKQRAASGYNSMRTASLGINSGVFGVNGFPSAKAVSAITATPQHNGYYCGPATLVSLLKAKGLDISQDEAARSLGTTAVGTAWWTNSSPMANSLNYYYGGAALYNAVGLPSVPSAQQQQDFRNALIQNSNDGFGIAGNIVEPAGAYHLPGHPTGITVYHWLAIRGYSSSGETTSYVDSAYTVWKGVSANSQSVGTTTMVQLLGDRGYVW